MEATIERTGTASVPRVDLMDWTTGRTCTNFNPFRQRTLSRAQSAVLSTAALVAEGDLAAISAAADVSGRIGPCELSQGDWEPQRDGSWSRFGCEAALCDERDGRTVRITCKSGRKDAWLEITYDDFRQAEAVLAAVGVRAARWDDWEAREAEADATVAKARAEGRDPLYPDIPF